MDKAPFIYYKYTSKGVERIDGLVIGETRWTLYVNQQELTTVMCTPRAMHYWAVGFCLNEGLIHSLGDMSLLCVYVRVREPAVRAELVRRAGLPSGASDEDVFVALRALRDRG